MPEEFAKSLKPTGVRCPICKDGEPTLWRSVFQHKYLRCSSCGVAYLERTPSSSELERFYNTSFQVDRDSQERKIDRRSRSLLRVLEQFLPKKGSLLEIGCSYGHFLSRARQVGWQVEGVEIARVAADCARETSGIPVHIGTLEDVLPALSPPYDAVAMLHLLEHDPEPIRLVSHVRQLLRPGGILAIKTPNASSWIARLCGRTWEWLTPPAHVFLFSPTSLRHLLQRAGFQVELVETQRGDAHNMLFEIARSAVKHLSRPNGVAAVLGTLPPSRRGWYRGIELTSDLLYRPFELMENLVLGRRLLQPELLVLGRRSQ